MLENYLQWNLNLVPFVGYFMKELKQLQSALVLADRAIKAIDSANIDVDKIVAISNAQGKLAKLLQSTVLSAVDAGLLGPNPHDGENIKSTLKDAGSLIDRMVEVTSRKALPAKQPRKKRKTNASSK